MSTTTIAPTSVVSVPVDEFAPCGCFACDKWSDCDFCSGCNPHAETAWEDAQDRMAQRAHEREGSLAEWLYGTDES